jgi:hypothetical protein
VEWGWFYVVNALVIILGVTCAAVGWRQPWFALAFPALMVINATFFHVLRAVVTRINSPGLATTLLLFYSVAAWTYYGTWKDGILTAESGIVSGVVAALLIAYPIILLRGKGLACFWQGGQSPKEV